MFVTYGMGKVSEYGNLEHESAPSRSRPSASKSDGLPGPEQDRYAAGGARCATFGERAVSILAVIAGSLLSAWVRQLRVMRFRNSGRNADKGFPAFPHSDRKG